MTCRSTPEMLGCQACSLHLTRTQVVPGHGDPNANIALIGEAPGADEDAKGEPFVGPAGQRLNRQLVVAGVCRLVSSAEGAACIRHDAQAHFAIAGAMLAGLCSTHGSIAASSAPGSVLPINEGVMQQVQARRAYVHQAATLVGAETTGALPDTAFPQISPGTPAPTLGQSTLPQVGDSGTGADQSSAYDIGLLDQCSPPRQSSQPDTQPCRYCTVAREQCQPIWCDNVVHSRPPDNKLRDYPDAQLRCPPLWLMPMLQQVKPRVVVALGRTAGSIWMPGLDAHEMNGLVRSVGGEYLVVGSWHPSYALRSGGEWNSLDDAVVANIKLAVELVREDDHLP